MTAASWWPPRLRAELAAAQETIGELAAALAGECRCPDGLRDAVARPDPRLRVAAFTWPGHGGPAAEVVLALSGPVRCCEVRGALVSATLAHRPRSDVPTIGFWDFPPGLLGAAASWDGTFGVCLASGLPRPKSALTRSLILREARRRGWRLNPAAPSGPPRGRLIAVAAVTCVGMLAALCAMWLSRPVAPTAPAHARPVYMGVPTITPHHRNA